MPKRVLTIEAINQRLKETGVKLEPSGNKLSLLSYSTSEKRFWVQAS